MFANFPGFLIAKAATRQQTSIIRVPPGGGQPVDTLGKPISQSVMPLPYNTTQMPPLMQLVEIIADHRRPDRRHRRDPGRRGQPGRAGRHHAGFDRPGHQDRELRPQARPHRPGQGVQADRRAASASTPRTSCAARRRASRARTGTPRPSCRRCDSCDLVPQADPNTSSQLQRMMTRDGHQAAAGPEPESLRPDRRRHLCAEDDGGEQPAASSSCRRRRWASRRPNCRRCRPRWRPRSSRPTPRRWTRNRARRSPTPRPPRSRPRRRRAASPRPAAAAGAAPTGFDALDAKAKMMDAQTRQFTAHAKVGEMQQQSQEKRRRSPAGREDRPCRPDQDAAGPPCRRPAGADRARA